MSNRPQVPLFATINVTGYCNLSCRYCFFQPRSYQHMAWPNFQRVINELTDAEVFFVNLSGGEPFTHPEFDKFLRYAHSKFQHVVVLTNGTILRPRHIEAVAEIIRSKDSFPIQISLDSVSSTINEKTRGENSRILKNIRSLSTLGANIVIAMVITRFNAGSVIESIIELSQYTAHFHIMAVQKVRALNGADEVYLLGEDELAQLWEDIRILRSVYNLHIDIPDDDCGIEIGCAFGAPCMAGFTQMVIDPSLKVRPCDRCVETYIGDMNHESLHEVWNGESVEHVLNSPVPFCQREEQTISLVTG